MALRGVVESGFLIGVAIVKVLDVSIFVVGSIIAIIVAAARPRAVVAVHGGMHL